MNSESEIKRLKEIISWMQDRITSGGKLINGLEHKLYSRNQEIRYLRCWKSKTERRLEVR